MDDRLHRPAARLWFGVFVLACAVLAGCVSTRPWPLPSGATLLELKTQPPPQWALIRGGCNVALILPMVIERRGGEMIFVEKDTNQQRPLSWPSGFSARVVDGTAELVTPDGGVLGREGDVLSTLKGGVGDNGDLLVCFGSPDEYPTAPPKPN